MKLADYVKQNRARWGHSSSRRTPKYVHALRILDLLANERPESSLVVAERLGITKNAACAAMNRLKKSGKIRMVKYWEIANSEFAESENE